MSKKLSDKIIDITAKLMMVSDRAEALRLSAELSSVAQELLTKETTDESSIHTKSVTVSLPFTEKEISKMDKTFKREFVANGLAAHVTKRKSGKRGYYYQIRYRRNGYDIEASSVDLKEAKRKFLEKTTPDNIGKYHVLHKSEKTISFKHIFEEWYQCKDGTISAKALQRFRTNFYDLPKSLQESLITDIRPGDLNKVMRDVKPRKYEDLRTLFNGIFKYAIASGLMTHNPVGLIKFKRAERKNRDALSHEEILTFLERVKHPKFDGVRQCAYLLYFFGLRPCEVDEETRREGDFLIARNRKRKGGKIEYKKIPIPAEAEMLIDWNAPLNYSGSVFTRDDILRDLLSPKSTYYLRHTFATTCQQFVRPDIVDIWMGDSSERLVGKVYTHFSDEFMQEQMKKIKFVTLNE